MEFPWWAIEPRKKEGFDWSRSDLIVSSAQQAGIQLVAVLVFTPSWATSGCVNPVTGCDGDVRASTCAAQPPVAEDLADFVDIIASRYRGRIGYWELWNEPDLPHYFSGTAADYAMRVLAPGHAAVKRADSSAQVVFGGPSRPNTRWIDAVLSAEGGVDFDIMSFHEYRGVRTALRGAGDVARLARGRPVWLTEYGSQDSARQVGLIRETLHADSSPFAACLWYELRDDEIFSATGYCRTETFGLTDHSYNPKPSFEAFRSLLS